jgi:hypothetical protein
MTRDEEVALVARIAGRIFGDPSVFDERDAVNAAAAIVARSNEAVDSKRGCERDWERLEAAARAFVYWFDDVDFNVHDSAEFVENLRSALDALHPKKGPAP